MRAIRHSTCLAVTEELRVPEFHWYRLDESSRFA
jgi:hypothetical protein